MNRFFSKFPCNPVLAILLGLSCFAAACSGPVDESADAGNPAGETIPVRTAAEVPASAVLPPATSVRPPSPKETTASPAPIEAPVPAVPTSQSAPDRDVPYRIGGGDSLEVTVYHHQDLTGRYKVDPDGTIRYPLIGSMRVAGLTAKEASDRLKAALEEKYLVEAQLNLEVKEFLSKPVNVLGSVRIPGKYYLKAQTTLMDILTEAGGAAANSGDVVTVTRRVSDGKGGSFSKIFTMSLPELLRGQGSSMNILLQEGDTVNLPERPPFYVYGEVIRPGPYRVESGMTLLKAISAAGGLGKFASKRGVEIHRKVGGVEDVLRFNLSKIEGQDEPDPPILAEDIINVTRRFF